MLTAICQANILCNIEHTEFNAVTYSSTGADFNETKRNEMYATVMMQSGYHHFLTTKCERTHNENNPTFCTVLTNLVRTIFARLYSGFCLKTR